MARAHNDNKPENALFGDLFDEETQVPSAQSPTSSSPVTQIPVHKCIDEDTEPKKKRTFFLTQRNYEALMLRNAISSEKQREYSKIVNDALEVFLAEERAALAQVGMDASSETERYRAALCVLLGNRLAAKT